MSNQIVAALERAAKEVIHALGEGASKAEHRLLHETADNLETAAKKHIEHDGKAAKDIEAAAKRTRNDTPTAHSSNAPGTTTPTGPNGKPLSKAEQKRRADPGYGKTPVRAATDPVTVPGAAPYDPKVAAKVEPWGINDVKTRGVLVKNGQETPLTSGRKGPSQDRGGPGTGMNGNVKTHVEAHAGSSLKPGEEGTLYINRVPCPGDSGCEANLARYVPKGATLTVYGPDGYVRVVHGEGPP